MQHNTVPAVRPLQPALHKPVPLETRVIVPTHYLGEGRKSYAGTVVGIASMHIIFTYIVLLDEPIEDSQYGYTRAITVDGCNLRGEDGTDWRRSRD